MAGGQREVSAIRLGVLQWKLSIRPAAVRRVGGRTDDALRRLHLRGELFAALSGGRDAQAAIGRVSERERVALGDVEAGEGFLGQHDADGVANLAEFQFENHVKT